MERAISPGDELRCPHCERWHLLIRRHQEGTDYTQGMLYFGCRGGFYYAGQIGTSSRFPTRQRDRRHA